GWRAAVAGRCARARDGGARASASGSSWGPGRHPLAGRRRREARGGEHRVQERDGALRAAEVERDRRGPKAEQGTRLGGERRPVEQLGLEDAHGPKLLEPSGPDTLHVLAQLAAWHDQRGYTRAHGVERRVVAAPADPRRRPAELRADVG